MDSHFINTIEINNFKCFQNFKAEGFGRVNLIGGKNNVGKTAFMEACFLSQSNDTTNLFERLLEIKTHRDVVNNLLLTSHREEDLQKLIKDNIGISIYIQGQGGHEVQELKDSSGSIIDERYATWENGLVKIEFDKILNIYTKYTKINEEPPSFDFDTGEPVYSSSPDRYTISELVGLLDMAFDSTKARFSLNFISPYSNSNQELENIIGQSKLDNKYDELNKYLLVTFGVAPIDIIKNKPMLKEGNAYKDLSYYGQGIKTFINIISSILLLKDDQIFIDEIENSIHYTHLDKLWELILTISKDQNVQVFATTHSKECIESFNRVQRQLEDKETYYFEMYKNIKDNKIEMRSLEDEQLAYELSHEGRLRGE
ncbi:MAG: AAA family ATPase [Sulfurimonas sp.]|jgi:AAA15 family ATPase/GTPase